MKANISNLTQHRIIEEVNQDVLQREENSFAERHGMLPREVKYKPFNREESFDIILDHMVNTFYPLNTEEFISIHEFKDKVKEVYGADIQLQLDSIEALYNGCFFRSRPDYVYIYSNSITDLVKTKYTLKHETLHAGLYDLIRGKIPKIRYYRSNDFNLNFMRNMITENKMQTLVHNKNAQVLSKHGDQNALFHNYSFEENFVVFNAVCSMLEEEVNASKYNIKNIISILSIYINDSGFIHKRFTDDLTVCIGNTILPMKLYLPTYLAILRGPVEKYDEDDKIYSSIIETFPVEQYQFEEIESSIPELFEKLLSLFLQQPSPQQLSAAINRFKSEEKSKPRSQQATSNKTINITND